MTKQKIKGLTYEELYPEILECYQDKKTKDQVIFHFQKIIALNLLANDELSILINKTCRIKI